MAWLFSNRYSDKYKVDLKIHGGFESRIRTLIFQGEGEFELSGFNIYAKMGVFTYKVEGDALIISGKPLPAYKVWASEYYSSVNGFWIKNESSSEPQTIVLNLANKSHTLHWGETGYYGKDGSPCAVWEKLQGQIDSVERIFVKDTIILRGSPYHRNYLLLRVSNNARFIVEHVALSNLGIYCEVSDEGRLVFKSSFPSKVSGDTLHFKGRISGKGKIEGDLFVECEVDFILDDEAYLAFGTPEGGAQTQTVKINSPACTLALSSYVKTRFGGWKELADTV